MRAALYARYSMDRQNEESISDQFRQCERVAGAAGFEVVARFSDAGISGGTSLRPGYQQLLTSARGHDFDIIVTEDLSRLWRSRAEFGPRSAELEDLNVHLVTCVGDDTRRDGYGLVLGIKSAIAEHQRREISYRTRRGMEGLATAGKSTGGRCFGYGSPAEARAVLELFRSRAAGMELRVLVDRLNAEGVAAPRGDRWCFNTVKRILRNRRYTGTVAWGASQNRTRAQDGRRGKPAIRPEGPLVVRHDESTRLISEELFDAAQRPPSAYLQRACNPGASA
jgi:site-specific DNA recombinase